MNKKNQQMIMVGAIVVIILVLFLMYRRTSKYPGPSTTTTVTNNPEYLIDGTMSKDTYNNLLKKIDAYPTIPGTPKIKIKALQDFIFKKWEGSFYAIYLYSNGVLYRYNDPETFNRDFGVSDGTLLAKVNDSKMIKNVNLKKFDVAKQSRTMKNSRHIPFMDPVKFAKYKANFTTVTGIEF